jgi:TRAP transporter TAXI family solute receptor
VLAIYSGSPGGGWYPIAVAAGELWTKNIPGVSVTHADAGGAGNVVALSAGKAQVAITTGASVGDAVVGNPPFEGKITNVRALAALAPEFYAILTWADSKIKTPADLKGKRLSPCPRGYTVEVITRSVLKASGMSYDNLGKVDFMDLEEAAGLMKDGHLDAVVASISLTDDPTITDLETTRAVKVLEIPNDMMKKLQAVSPGLYPATLPRGSYKGVTKNTQIPGYSLGLAVSADLPEDLVYQMTKALVDNWATMQAVSADLKDLKPQDLAKPTMGVAFHPGAQKFYKEKGWIK